MSSAVEVVEAVRVVVKCPSCKGEGHTTPENGGPFGWRCVTCSGVGRCDAQMTLEAFAKLFVPGRIHDDVSVRNVLMVAQPESAE